MLIGWWVSDAGVASVAVLPDADLSAVATGDGRIDFRPVYPLEHPRFRQKPPAAPAKFQQPDIKKLAGLNPTGLTRLSFEDESVTDADLAPLAKFTDLEALDLTCCAALTDAVLDHLKGLKKLHTLVLADGPRVTDAGMKVLSGMTRLRHLNLDRAAAGVTDEGLKHLGNLKDLESLSFAGTKAATPAALEHLAGLTRLRHLDAPGLVTDESARHLKGMLDLGYLNAWGGSLGDAGLAELHGLKKLAKLSIGGPKAAFTPLGVLRLHRSLPELEVR